MSLTTGGKLYPIRPDRTRQAGNGENRMKKYQLFSEFCDKTIYGDDVTDAINRLQVIPRPSIGTGDARIGTRIYTPQDPIIIKAVIGIEDTSNSRRGNDTYIRVIVEDTDGKVHGIDLHEITVNITVNGGVNGTNSMTRRCNHDRTTNA